jgi:hypothetical protein
MRREWAVQVIAASLALAAFVGAGLFIRPINAIRQERQLVMDPESMKGLPPGLALLGKLGTLRALAIDWASIRAERLKEEGKTYEALQLHETVCALAPRFPNVWVNAAWNMAYNISVSQYSPEARWQWVQNGIRILRDEGIRYNPNAVALYKELAWIYWHKIGDFLDDEHLSSTGSAGSSTRRGASTNSSRVTPRWRSSLRFSVPSALHPTSLCWPSWRVASVPSCERRSC